MAYLGTYFKKLNQVKCLFLHWQATVLVLRISKLHFCTQKKTVLQCIPCNQSESLCSTFQACYEGGTEVIVVPKTTASSDSPWFGLAIYAWSG